MAYHHSSTAAERTQTIAHLLAHAGAYGVVTQLSQTLADLP